MAEAGILAPAPTAPAAARYLTFRAQGRLYALAAEQVSEVIRVPPVARVPLGPAGLLGIANLRGAAIPVASLRGLLGLPEAPATAAARAVVLQGAAPVALAVDEVVGLVTAPAGQVETRQARLGALAGERLRAAFPSQGGGEATKVIDLPAHLAEAFVARASGRLAGVGVRRGSAPARSVVAEAMRKLVTFDVAGQEYGLDLGAVQEIVSAPQNLATVPHAEAVVAGVMAHRDGLLPLLSLRGLLGFKAAADPDGRRKVVVATVRGAQVGLLADRMRDILAADPQHLDPTPPMLAARIGGEAAVQAIYRAEGGRRLVSVLDPEKLFREDVMQEMRRGEGEGLDVQPAVSANRQFVVFQLGEETFGLPIEAVDEVARAPDQVTSLPKAPKFLEGVINLRGEVLPVIDQRKRFELPPMAQGAERRLVVVRTARHRAGLLVDTVSEVLRVPADRIEDAPALAGETTRLIHGVVNLEESGRIILLVDPDELLTRTEARLLTAFQAGAGRPTE